MARNTTARHKPAADGELTLYRSVGRRKEAAPALWSS